MDPTDSELVESTPIKTEFKTEYIDETSEVTKNTTTLKYEVKSEVMDTSYPLTVKWDPDGQESDKDYLPIETELKSEDIDETSGYGHESYEFVEIHENFGPSKYEVRSEETNDGGSEDKQWQKTSVGVSNAVTEKEKKLFFCANCDYSTKYKHKLVQHIKKVHLGNEEKYPCVYCDKEFNHKRSLDGHIIKNHQDAIDSVSSKIHNCPACDYKTTYKILLKRHTIQVHLGAYEKHSCAGCEKHFKNKMSLDDHIIKNHQHLNDSVRSKVHNCLLCHYKTTKKDKLKTHTTRVHSGEKHSCICCERYFKNKTSLDDHIIKNHESLIEQVSSKVHNCPTCDYKTTMTNYLRHHTMKVHAGNYEKYSCTCCEKHFKNKLSLDDHIIKKHQHLIDSVSRKVHSCPTCHYKTAKAASFRYHTIKVHSGEEHSCTHCKKHYRTRILLEDHIIKKHQNLMDMVSNKVHNCPACDYKTVIKSQLAGHTLKAHSENDKKHPCTGCEKQFMNKKSLDDHVVKNHQNLIELVSSKVHSCTRCSYKTTRMTDFKRHMLKDH